MRMNVRFGMSASLRCGCELVLRSCRLRGAAAPLVAPRREQRVDDRHKYRGACKRPENSVRTEQAVVDVPTAERHERGEKDPSGPRVGRGLRIGNHEEG